MVELHEVPREPAVASEGEREWICPPKIVGGLEAKALTTVRLTAVQVHLRPCRGS